MGHSKEGCPTGAGKQSDNVQVEAQMDNVQQDVETDSFGPWMQVSYGRAGRNNMGSFYAGKKTGPIAHFGKINSGNRSANGPPGNGAGSSGNTREGRRDSVRGVVGSEPRKVANVNRGGKTGAKKVDGSRFSILSKGLEEELGMDNSGAGPSSHIMGDDSTVLAEISNTGSSRMTAASSTFHKYLKDDVTGKTSANKPFKNIAPMRRIVRRGRLSTKGKSHVIESKAADTKEELEDTEVLQSLHKEVMGAVGGAGQSFPSPGEWEVITAILLYERLPEFCYACGIIGHGLRDCPDDEARLGALEGETTKYGSWLRAATVEQSKARIQKNDSNGSGTAPTPNPSENQNERNSGSNKISGHNSNDSVNPKKLMTELIPVLTTREEYERGNGTGEIHGFEEERDMEIVEAREINPVATVSQVDVSENQGNSSKPGIRKWKRIARTKYLDSEQGHSKQLSPI
ncbi:hypothetical protein LWI29_025123 [Acer saccharum]|uniref:CCHC-type domain-containing protein n=1 Tax=Acer saccharum TaxID=4024 RepID=A0AA39SHU3_ACESA|nr:hypothetical protein LWI29_025123 [Acer saccharum]